MDVVRSVFPDEHDDAGHVAHLDVVDLSGDDVHQVHVVGHPGELRVRPEPRQPDQDVAVVFVDEGGVDAQVPGYRLRRPAPGEGQPGLVQTFEHEVTEVGLQKLLQVVAELHVEVSVEYLFPVHPGWIDREGIDPVENVYGGLAENPCRVVSGHHFDAEAQVPVSREDVDGPAHLEGVLIRPVILRIPYSDGGQ